MKEETNKVKLPAEWKRLRLNSDYFVNNTAINSVSIRDSLSIDSGVSVDNVRHTRQSSGGLQEYDVIRTPKHSPEVGRKQKVLEQSDDSGEQKKKTWFKIFNKKKRNSMGNVLDSPETISNDMFDSIHKRLSDSPQTMLRSPRREKRPHRKSEGDINYNIKVNHEISTQDLVNQHEITTQELVNQQKLNGVQLSLC